MKSAENAEFRCAVCGELLGVPLDWSLEAPDFWLTLSEEDRKLRGVLGSDECIVDDKHFFIRGVIEIPIIDAGDTFAYGVWVSLSKSNFECAARLWDNPERIHAPLYFGWLSNSIYGYPDTLNLKTNVHTREVGMRPLIELEPTDHPLAVEQRNGITMARVREIAELNHHRGQTSPTPEV